MPTEADKLVNVMNQIDALESTIAFNNLVAGGVVSDLQQIRDAAQCSNTLLEMQLLGIRMMFSDDPEMIKAKLDMIDIVTK
jgi:hypothetical protein